MKPTHGYYLTTAQRSSIARAARILRSKHNRPDIPAMVFWAINITLSTIDSLKLAIKAGEKLILELEKGRDLS